MKKNTMLTLEKDLVEYAKKFGINLSGIAEKAIRMELNKRLNPTGENIVHIPKTEKIVLKGVGPFKNKKIIEFTSGVNIIRGAVGSGKSTIIKSLKAGYNRDLKPPEKNEGIKNSEESFIEVFPENGKIIKELGDNKRSSFKENSTDGVELRFQKYTSDRNMCSFEEKLKKYLDKFKDLPFELRSENDRELSLFLFNFIATKGNECLLDDSALSVLDLEIKELLLDFLRRQNNQIILTSHMGSIVDDKINIIELD